MELSGRVVGVTADRRGDDQVVMFSRMGAEVVHGPTISTRKLPDPDLLRLRTEQLIADPPDYLIADTGIGIRTWLEAADGWGLAAPLTEALGRTRIAARGPKAAGALSSAGLRSWWRSPDEQLSTLVDHLAGEGLHGRTVAFQLHGDDAAGTVDRLQAAGAQVTTLPVYVWGPPADLGPATGLIERICAGEVHAVTFTAGPQVGGLLDVAEWAGRRAEVLGVLGAGRVVVGCIGPVCAAVAEAAGLANLVVPSSWRLGSLVKAVSGALSR